VMHGHERSDSAILAKKPPNKAGKLAAEAVEPRAGTKGNMGQHSTRRTQIRESVSQALDRVRKAADKVCLVAFRQAPEVGAGCLNWARPDLCGGRGVTHVPTAIIGPISGSARCWRLSRRSWPGGCPSLEASLRLCTATFRTGCLGPMIGIGDASRRRPSHTTRHTGPYHGGSTGLSFCGDIQPRQAEIIEYMVAQGVLDRGV
jgi:hypothetical protein